MADGFGAASMSGSDAGSGLGPGSGGVPDAGDSGSGPDEGPGLFERSLPASYVREDPVPPREGPSARGTVVAGFDWAAFGRLIGALVLLGAMSWAAIWWWGFSEDARARGARQSGSAAESDLARLRRPFAFATFTPHVEAREAASRFAATAARIQTGFQITETADCFHFSAPLGQIPDCIRLDVGLQGTGLQPLLLARRVAEGARIFIDLTPAADNEAQSARMTMILDWLAARDLEREGKVALLATYRAFCNPEFRAMPACWRTRPRGIGLTYGLTAAGQPYLALDEASPAACLEPADATLIGQQFPLHSEDPLTACRWLAGAGSRLGLRLSTAP